jgi:hypothetical protein
MAFLTVNEMKTHVFPGIRNAVTNFDDSIMQSAIDAAVSEAKGYCSRYDVTQLFDGSDRDAMLLQHVKSLAKWNFIGLANPNIDYADAQLRYEFAKKTLQDIQSGKLVPDGWAVASPNERSTTWHVGSTTKKRNNQFTGLPIYDPTQNPQ